MRADHIGSDEIVGTQNGSIDVRFRGKVHQGVDLVLSEQPAHFILVADIASDKQIARVVCNVQKTVNITRIGQGVEAHPPALAVIGKPVVHEVRADETRTSRNEQVTRLEAHPTSSSNFAANESLAA